MLLATRARGRSGPDFAFLGERRRAEPIGLRYRKVARSGESENSRFERSLNSISTVTGWGSQTVRTRCPW